MIIYTFPTNYKDKILKEDGKRLDLDKVKLYQKIFKVDLDKDLKEIKKEEYSDISIIFFTLTDDFAMKKTNIYYVIKAYHSRKSNKNSNNTYQKYKIIGERNIGTKDLDLMKQITKNVNIWSFKNSNNINDKSTKINNILFNELISFKKKDYKEIINKFNKEEKMNFLQNLEKLTTKEIKHFDRELLVILAENLPLISNKIRGRI